TGRAVFVRRARAASIHDTTAHHDVSDVERLEGTTAIDHAAADVRVVRVRLHVVPGQDVLGQGEFAGLAEGQGARVGVLDRDGQTGRQVTQSPADATSMDAYLRRQVVVAKVIGSSAVRVDLARA